MSRDRKRYIIGLALGTIALGLPHVFDRNSKISTPEPDLDFKPQVITDPHYIFGDPPTFSGDILYAPEPEVTLIDSHQIKRINGPLFLKEQSKPYPARFDIDLYKVVKKPDTHLHIRYVDYNDIGYGGGLKIALEIVEEF